MLLPILGCSDVESIPTTPIPEVHVTVRNMAAAVPVLNPALWVAALRGQTEAARQLLLAGANTEEQGGTARFQSTPLQVASRRGHVDLVELLLENRADATVNVGGGRTILHEAARRGRGAISLLLLQHGADVSARDNGGFTPLDAVAMEGREEVAVLLLQYGADVSAQDLNGMTALHWAAHQGHVAMVRVLIAHRANVAAQDTMGLTAEDYATSQSHPHVVAMLRAEAVTRAKCVAFAMGHHERLGAGSLLRLLDLEVTRMVLEQV